MDAAQTLGLGLQYHQAGNLGEAEAHYRRALQLEPRHPDALHLLGVIGYQVHRFDFAIEMMRAALRENPNMAAAHCNLGAALQITGQMDEAIASFRRALQLQPDYFEAYNNLGGALQNQDKAAEAVAILQQAVRLRPGDAIALTNLGIAHHKLGHAEEAMAYHRQAILHQPNHADAHNNLGSVLQSQGKLGEAAASYEQALRINPGHVDALSNLGLVLLSLGRVDEAIAHQRRAVELKPNHAPAHNNLGVTLTQQGNLEEAATCYAEAVRLQPNYAEALRNLGKIRLHQGRLDEALVHYEQALRLHPEAATSHCELGRVLQDFGNFEAAERAFREALRLAPGHAESLWGLTVQLRNKLPAADRDLMERRLAEPNLTDDDRGLLFFSLAQLHDANGEYDRAAGQLRQANALKTVSLRQTGRYYQTEKNHRFIDNVIAGFTPAFFERTRGFGLDTERPVFIFGLPRSGTTITEQILAKHSQVFCAGELFLAHEDFSTLGTKARMENGFPVLSELNRDTVCRMAQQHLDHLSAVNATAPRIVDKMPDNYQYLGLLALMFPKAKFIHCRRDLRDVALSCWVNPIGNNWSNEIDSIVSRFRDYQRVMEHWHKVLPIPMLEVNYEETVVDLPGAARRLVAWCGLEWEDACLKFNEGIRPVRTASKAQVREPVYTRSVGRWRKYESELSDLFAAVKPMQDREAPPAIGECVVTERALCGKN